MSQPWQVVAVGSQLCSARRPALGTTAQVITTTADLLARALPIVDRELEALDLVASRFRRDSELSRLNRSPGRGRELSPRLAELVALALEGASLTGGLVDPTVGRALRTSGYDRDFDLLAEGQAIGQVLEPPSPCPGWRQLHLHGRWLSWDSPVELDLGATAKAWCADRCARAIHDVTSAPTLVSLGGDLAVAGREPATGWVVRVADDHEAGARAPGQTVRLVAPGLATSSTVRRRWQQAGEERHHLIDPRTGRAAPVIWRTASVSAPSCTLANVFSTAAVVAGGEAAALLAKARLPARLVSAGGKVAHLGGWPPAGDDLPELVL